MISNKKIFFVVVIFLSIGFLVGCSKRSQNKIVKQPAESTKPLKIKLGKTLFFDPILSKDRTVSCATCHNPRHGFADFSATSAGIMGQKGDRNTPTVFNTAKLKLLFWDGRAKGLEDQALGPIQNPIEMGETIEGVLEKLNNSNYYKEAFAKAYGVSEITAKELANAIAEYERTVISKDSPFDKYLAGDESAISEGARRGYELFKGKAMCIACHSGPDFTDGAFHNIGLPTEDLGRAKISEDEKDTRAFKTPTLREIAKTGPYFHDGSFETLEAVIAYYNAGGGADEYKDELKVPLELTQEEQGDLVSFLKSLSGTQKEETLPEIPKD